MSNSGKFCSGDNATLTSSNGVSYLWSTGDTTQSIFVTAGGNYTVIVRDTNGCVSTSSISTVVEIFPPYVDLGNDTTLCEGENLEINLNISGANYLWSDGSNKSNFLINKEGM